MAVCAFVRSLLHCRLLLVDNNQSAQLSLPDEAILSGTAGLRTQLKRLFDAAWNHATGDERLYLPVILQRIENGSLVELIARRDHKRQEMNSILTERAMCLKFNTS